MYIYDKCLKVTVTNNSRRDSHGEAFISTELRVASWVHRFDTGTKSHFIQSHILPWIHMLHFSEKPNCSPVPAAFQRGISLKGNALCLCLLWLYHFIEKILSLLGLHTQAGLELSLTLLGSATVCDGGTLPADRTRSHVCKVQQTPAKGSIYKNAATSTAIFLLQLCLNCFTSTALPQFVLLNAAQKVFPCSPFDI